jgi:hypothetical protein
MDVHGSCHCGRISYEAEVDSQSVGICNCTDCQMLTGSAFRVTVAAASTHFRLLTGEPTTYIKTADSGAKRRHAFCPTCGSPVYACAATDAPASFSLRVGCLKEKAQLPPTRQIWCSSALEWVKGVGELPGRDRQ